MKKIKQLIEKVEFSIFKILLKRHANLHMDQWSRWKFESQHGNVFVSIDRQGDGHQYSDLK